MKSWPKFALFLVLAMASSAALAADLAILSNGNSIRHEHRRSMGTVTRLYLGADEENFIDVPTKDIDHFEKDLSPAPLPAASSLHSGIGKFAIPGSGKTKSGSRHSACSNKDHDLPCHR